MERSELLPLLPKNKGDVARASALVKLGYPTIEPVLGDLIAWLRTNGSPVDLALRPFFASLGEHALPVVREVLRSKHELQQSTVLSHVVRHWPTDVVAQLRPELESLATGSSFYGVDLAALELLVRNGISEPSWLQEWAAFKVKRLSEFLALAEQVKSLANRNNAA